MKKLLVLGVILCVIVVVVISCDEDGGGTAGIYDFFYHHKDVTAGCPYCNERYYFTFSNQNSGGHYYWIAVKDKWGDMMGHGRYKYINGPFTDVMHYIDVSYNFKLDSSVNYSFYVYACNDSSFIGFEKGQVGSSGPVDTSVCFIYNEPSCRSTCCTKSAREYARVFRDEIGITGAAARMKARFGQLCGYSISKFDTAFSVIHTSVSYETQYNQVVWSQMGFGQARNQFAVLPGICKFVYGEVNDTDSTQWAFIPGNIKNDDIFDYEMVLDYDQNIGTWTFILNNDSVFALASYDWNTYGLRAWWVGEILNFEDDMCGTNSDKVVLSQCKYLENTSGWKSPNFKSTSNPPTITRSDDEEWWIYLFDDNTVHIWDKVPLP